MSLKPNEKTIVEAIEERYGSNGDEDILAIVIYVPKGAPGQKDTGEIIVPQELSLNKCGISCAGDTERIKDLCGKKVTLLDLSENNFSQWNEIFTILDAVPLCSFLDLRDNPLSHTLQCDQLLSKTYALLSKLVLNGLRLPWETVTRLLQLFPSLMEIHLSLNDYQSVDVGTHCYPRLKSLHFSNNVLSHWTEVAKLGKAFPNLECLFLLKNPLSEFPKGEDISQDFPNLQTLSLSETQLGNWTDLEKFRRFPCLTELRAQGIDFSEDYEEELRRQLILGYLPNVQRLNGGRVTDGEKEDAERAFIRHYMDKTGTLPERYHELEGKHGKLDPLVDIKFTPKKQVSVQCHYKGRTFLKRLDLNWTLTNLKKYLEADVDLSSYQMTLFLHQVYPYEWTDRMIHPKRTMLRYKIDDGDEIYIEQNNTAKMQSTAT